MQPTMHATARTARGFATTIAIREHHLTADEPVSEGGHDAGPTPVELMLSGLAACTTITARMYADRKGFEVEGVTAHASLEQGSGTKGPAIRLEIAIRGNLTSEQRARVVEIAGRCPVHRMIERATHVETVDVSDAE